MHFYSACFRIMVRVFRSPYDPVSMPAIAFSLLKPEWFPWISDVLASVLGDWKSWVPAGLSPSHKCGGKAPQCLVITRHPKSGGAGVILVPVAKVSFVWKYPGWYLFRAPIHLPLPLLLRSWVVLVGLLHLARAYFSRPTSVGSLGTLLLWVDIDI